MTDLYTLAQLLAATNGRAEGPKVAGVGGVTIDSREVPERALFVAIKGDRLDGHDFVAEAFDKGAALALVSAERASEFAGQPLLVVADTLEALRAIAGLARHRSKALIAAVTGSVGKTTTKELIRVALAEAGPTHASIKSFNNHWGVPLMLARMRQDTQFGIFEIGMNHAGEITPLSRLVSPHVAVITAVAAAHLEAFNSVADIAWAKAEILAGLDRDGTLILGADHDYLDILVQAARDRDISYVVTYGFSPAADVVITDYEETEAGCSAKVEISGQGVRFTLAAVGRHLAANAVAALLVADAMGVPLEKAVRGIEKFQAGEGRGQVIKLGHAEPFLELLDESYNANPASMRAALDVFAHRHTANGRRVLVLGDMFELGVQSPGLHAHLADAVRDAHADAVFLVGPQMRHLCEALGEDNLAGRADSVEGITPMVLDTLAPGDLVMVKGSNGMRLGQLIAAIKGRFAAPNESESA